MSLFNLTFAHLHTLTTFAHTYHIYTVNLSLNPFTTFTQQFGTVNMSLNPRRIKEGSLKVRVQNMQFSSNISASPPPAPPPLHVMSPTPSYLSLSSFPLIFLLFSLLLLFSYFSPLVFLTLNLQLVFFLSSFLSLGWGGCLTFSKQG